MRRFRAGRANQAPLRIEPHAETAFFLHPEDVIEPVAETDGFVEKPSRAILLAQPPQQFGNSNLGGENKCLKLGWRNRILYLRAIRINDGIAGVLPTLVFEALFRPGLIGIKAVFTPSAALQPREPLERGIEKRPNRFEIAGPVPEV